MTDTDLDTWTSRDFPVLRAIVQLAEETQHSVRTSAIVERTGFDEDTVDKAISALESEYPPFFEAKGTFGGGYILVTKVSGHARRTVGAWPSAEGLADKLVAALSEAAEATEDEEKKSFLRRTASWFGSSGRDLLVDVTGAVVAKQLGA